jgi:hypothetical protein
MKGGWWCCAHDNWVTWHGLALASWVWQQSWLVPSWPKGVASNTWPGSAGIATNCSSGYSHILARAAKTLTQELTKCNCHNPLTIFDPYTYTLLHKVTRNKFYSS